MDKFEKVYAATMVGMLVVAVIFAFGLVAFIGDCNVRLGDELERNCRELCEGRGLEVASHTIYGCECREGDD